MNPFPQIRHTPTDATDEHRNAAPRGHRLPSQLGIRLFVRLYRLVLRRAARAALEGRPWDPGRPESGRFLRSEVDAFLEDVWVRVATLLREEDLNQIPTVGNRHNVFLGALTGPLLYPLDLLRPLGFVKRYVERHGGRGELEAFYRSWCLYDWPAADLLAGGKRGAHPHYQRAHTLSRGDSVCDMCWSASSLPGPPD